MSDYNQKIVEDYWSRADASASDRNFYCYPVIRSHSCKLIFGEADASRRDWCQYWTVEKYLKEIIPVKKCLSICCGFGEIERMLARLGVADHILGMDVAPGAIEKARERALAEGLGNIEYQVADLNAEELPVEEYDIIWANGALHHIRELDGVVAKLFRALKPGGYLVSNEYVGPDYQQLPRRQQEIVNAVKHLLPMELRSADDGRRPSLLSKIARRLRRKSFRLREQDEAIYARLWKMPTIDHFKATDPSECVRSSQIIPTLHNHFDSVTVRYFDGSILFYALDPVFYANFDGHKPTHRRLLELLFELERFYIDSGEMQSDNAHIICRKNP